MWGRVSPREVPQPVRAWSRPNLRLHVMPVKLEDLPEIMLQTCIIANFDVASLSALALRRANKKFMQLVDSSRFKPLDLTKFPSLDRYRPLDLDEASDEEPEVVGEYPSYYVRLSLFTRTCSLPVKIFSGANVASLGALKAEAARHFNILLNETQVRPKDIQVAVVLRRRIAGQTEGHPYLLAGTSSLPHAPPGTTDGAIPRLGFPSELAAFPTVAEAPFSYPAVFFLPEVHGHSDPVAYAKDVRILGSDEIIEAQTLDAMGFNVFAVEFGYDRGYTDWDDPRYLTAEHRIILKEQGSFEVVGHLDRLDIETVYAPFQISCFVDRN